MPHHDDSFWVAVFRKSPIIGSCMAVCAILAGVAGMFIFSDLIGFLRNYACAIIACALGGGFIGLVIGVALDSLYGAMFRKDDKKKRRDRWGRLD